LRQLNRCHLQLGHHQHVDWQTHPQGRNSPSSRRAKHGGQYQYRYDWGRGAGQVVYFLFCTTMSNGQASRCSPH